MVVRAEDLTGQRFGALVVLHRFGRDRHRGYALWLCQCDCGEQRVAQSSLLRDGRLKSCHRGGHRWGQYDQLRPRGLTMEYAREYSSWYLMRQRCLDPRNVGYYRYGGRGIVVCERWGEFVHFVEDMGHKPTPRHTIERIDNDGNYEPSNCCWATPEEQRRNKSNTVFVQTGGGPVPLLDVIDVLGLDGPLIRSRIAVGWTLEEAMTVPKAVRPKRPAPPIKPSDSNAEAKRRLVEMMSAPSPAARSGEVAH